MTAKKNDTSEAPPGVKIGEAAKAAGVSVQTVEYYVLLGLIEPIRRPPRRRRFFDEALVERIKVIHHLNQTGYTLKEIRKTFPRIIKVEG